VFAFNERAIRAYRKAGFTIEGRAREAIWRDGQFWDELAMSVLEDEWRELRTRSPRLRRILDQADSADGLGDVGDAGGGSPSRGRDRQVIGR
jgi:hypothetical protein